MATIARPVEPHTSPATRGRRLRGTAAIGPQRVLPVRDLVVLQIIVAAAAALWRWAHWPWWLAAGVGLLAAAMTVVRVRGRTVPAAVSARSRFLRDRRLRPKLLDPAPAFDEVDFDDQRYGLRWDGSNLVSVIDIDDHPDDLTVLDAGVTVSGEMVPLDILVDCLTQFDVELDSIEVISHGARSHGHTPVAAIYDAVLGPLPAIAHRTVRVVVRFDPSRCPRAVALRGGGRTGVLRTAMVATRRVANRLTGAGLRVRVLSSEDIGRAVGQLTDGVNLDNLTEEWTHCADGTFRMTSYALAESVLTTEGLGQVWTVPSYSTTVALTVRRDGEAVGISGTVRFDTYGEPDPTRLPGVSPLPGRQFRAVLSSLPIPRPAGSLAPWFYGEHVEDFAGIEVPAAGCGQVLGADDRGRAVALPVFGPQVERVAIAGSLHLVQQVVLRALALGARVLVHSTRPSRWRAMVGNVDDGRLLWVADYNRGTMQAGWDRNYSVAVFDGAAESPTRVGVTSIVVLAAGSGLPDADVVLEERPGAPDVVSVRTRSVSTEVTMVATDEEMRFIGSGT